MIPGIHHFYFIEIFAELFDDAVMSPFTNQISFFCFQKVFIMKTVFWNALFIQFNMRSPKLCIEIFHRQGRSRIIISQLSNISA